MFTHICAVQASNPPSNRCPPSCRATLTDRSHQRQSVTTNCSSVDEFFSCLISLIQRGNVQPFSISRCQAVTEALHSGVAPVAHACGWASPRADLSEQILALLLWPLVLSLGLVPGRGLSVAAVAVGKINHITAPARTQDGARRHLGGAHIPAHFQRQSERTSCQTRP